MADFISTKKTIRNKIPFILYPRAGLDFFLKKLKTLMLFTFRLQNTLLKLFQLLLLAFIPLHIFSLS